MVRGSHMPAQPGQKSGHHMSAIRPVLTGGMKKGGCVCKPKHHRKKHYHAGSKSKTHKGRKDFTTKKTSKVFHEKHHYVKKGRRPYHKRK